MPVLIIEIKDESKLEDEESRRGADLQMRSRFEVMMDSRLPHPLPSLWGISLFGTSARTYQADTRKKEVRPLMSPCLEAEEWGIDITSGRGFEEMKKTVLDIQSACNQIRVTDHL